MTQQPNDAHDAAADAAATIVENMNCGDLRDMLRARRVEFNWEAPEGDLRQDLLWDIAECEGYEAFSEIHKL